jgi:hypothetical protein
MQLDVILTRDQAIEYYFTLLATTCLMEPDNTVYAAMMKCRAQLEPFVKENLGDTAFDERYADLMQQLEQRRSLFKNFDA